MDNKVCFLIPKKEKVKYSVVYQICEVVKKNIKVISFCIIKPKMPTNFIIIDMHYYSKEKWNPHSMSKLLF